MKVATILFLGVVVLSVCGIPVVLAGEIDATTAVSRVIDGGHF